MPCGKMLLLRIPRWIHCAVRGRAGLHLWSSGGVMKGNTYLKVPAGAYTKVWPLILAQYK